MSRLTDFLENSRTARLIQQVEQGEDVDIRRVLTLQALELSRMSELALLDALEIQEAANVECERLGSGG
jgi:hypothetical protein